MAWGAAEIALADEATGAPAARVRADLATAARWARAYIAQGHGDTFNLYDTGAVAEAELMQAMRQAGLPGPAGRRCCATWPRSCGPARPRPRATRSRSAPSWARPTRRRTRSACTSPTRCTRSTAAPSQFASFAQQQLNFALGANGWGTSFVVGAGTVFPHCMQSEIANLAGSLTGTGDIQLGAVTDGPSTPDNFHGLGTVDGMRACSAGTSRRSTPRPPPTRTTWSPGLRSSPPTTTPPTPCWRSPWARLALADSYCRSAAAPKPAVLAIDGGNSKTDVALVAEDGTLLASARGPGINAHVVGVDQTVLILDAVVKQAAAQLDRPLSFLRSLAGPLARHTVACLANADLPEEEVEHAAAVQAQGWSASATVVNERSPSCGRAWPTAAGALGRRRGLRGGHQRRRRRPGRPRHQVPGPGYDLGRLGRRPRPGPRGALARDPRGGRPRPGHGAGRLPDQPLRRGAGRGGDDRHPQGQDPATTT